MDGDHYAKSIFHIFEIANMNSLMKVDDMVAIARMSYGSPTTYNGLSDHKIHCQLITTPGGFTFRLASWNVLNVKWVNRISGIGELPKWLKMENQFQLHTRPFCQPENQKLRRNLVLEKIFQILELNRRDRIPVIFCLQECDPSLYEDLAGFSHIQPQFQISVEHGAVPRLGDGWKPRDNFRMILSYGISNAGIAELKDFPNGHSINIEFQGHRFWIANLHMVYVTAHNHDNIAKIIAAIPENSDILIVGDLNIQVKPLTTVMLNERACTQTLDEFVHQVEKDYQREIRVCIHPDGWTNFNIVQNCAEMPYDVEDTRYKYNVDHFDNIILLSRDTSGWFAKGVPVVAEF